MTQSDRRLLSLIFLSFGVLHEFGELSSIALSCLFLSLTFAIMSFSPQPWGPRLPRGAATGLVLALAATTILYNNTLGHRVFLATFAGLAIAILLYSLVPARAAKVVAFALAGCSATAGLLANLSWGYLNMDVFFFQQKASAALLHGQNPYSPLVSSPNVLAPGALQTWIPLHFPYGPILPVLEVPFRILGDIRILHLVAAMVTASAVLLLARRAGTLDGTACVVMAFPLTIGMVLFSWVDIITMAGISIWIVLFRTHPKIATLALVLALGAKPTTLIAIVPIFFWSLRARRQVVIAAVLAAFFVVPFAVATGLSQFYYNVLGVQLAVFPRFDSLTVNSYLHAFNLPALPFAASAVVIGAVAILVLRRRPSTYGDLLTGTAILATVSFLVAKWAYFNYYYIPGVLLMLAVAGNSLALDAPEMIRPPSPLIAAADRLRAAAERIPRRGRPPGPAMPGRDRQEPAV